MQVNEHLEHHSQWQLKGKEEKRKEEEYHAWAIQTHVWHEVERGSLGAELRERARWGLFHLFVFFPPHTL